MSPVAARARSTARSVAPKGCAPRAARTTTTTTTRRPRRVLVARADPEDVGGAEADEFLGGAAGKFISGLTEFVQSSPINQGKIWLAKTQAGDYDAETTKNELQDIISSNPVVMFSFTT
uniref:Uncharacterized protein n=1 Tax=Chloropicon primus TaxID=1764295 RepID=A0A7S2WWS4_9CHLO|mmetsp:Transcript_1100/g.3233  ORF Transcript_1100/g.3233 Transcript_1100/m.3233 type:complete len:119 (+) Transcript_1100:91-447(+)